MKSDLHIAREANPLPISEIGASLGISTDSLISYGSTKAKLSHDFCSEVRERPQGKLVLVTAISPTPMGEGKTATAVGLADGLRHIGKNSLVCLREPSLGPVFGMKGGAAGGGFAQVLPMEDINLHFTGDLHAIGTAHNLLSAMLDNHLHWGNGLDFDVRRRTWGRVVDMNDRALRHLVAGLGGPGNSLPRQTGFDITVASEVMAVFCLADDLEDLQRRLGRIVVGYNNDGGQIRASELAADGAMTALLRDALQPNLVQTLEQTPAIIHGGPFANIAHGCNSVIATRTSLHLADYVVTEAGFGSDLGAEKFFNIKCRQAGLEPAATVLVATVRALKFNGGAPQSALESEDLAALEAGLVNLERHLDNLARYGVPVVVAINRFSADSDAELKLLADFCEARGVKACLSTHWADGGAGAADLARAVCETAEVGGQAPRFSYDGSLSLLEKIETVARDVYGAGEVVAEKKSRKHLEALEEAGYRDLPVCMAKTPYSFTADPSVKGAPSGFELPVREVRLSAGAGFVVVLCGDLFTMPGLPRSPAAERINVNGNGQIEGLF
ncbi:MAG: formate--tetrahydrofolate ligase [Halieaceae bacterium]|jgi:formate--tetrahydrofolate ligase|nr:formate--tetrahydrofolate ligase [Halieaceae bacterium]